MPQPTRFVLVREADDGRLTALYNAAAVGPATHVHEPLMAWLGRWQGAAVQFDSAAGFVGVEVADSQASVTVVQLGGPSVNAEFATAAGKLLHELLPALGVVAMRAVTATEPADRLLELAGFCYDGTLRRLLANGNGRPSDAGFWSLLPDDLAATERPTT